MATMKVYRNGLSSYMGGTGTHERSPRGNITGWSAATARRQRLWLWSINADDLTGHGYALTLTMRDCPPDAEIFHRLRRAWLKRQQRSGLIRSHWVVEWTARGIPHLHAAIYFEKALTPLETYQVVFDWLDVAERFGVGIDAQDMRPIAGVLGWLKYLAKHASRGANHYQRRGHPEGWNKSGRMWGSTGSWPALEPIVLEDLSAPEFWRLRRLMRAWARSDAAKVGDWKRLAYLRRAGRPPERQRSSYQGVSEWIPEAVTLRLIEYFENENL